MNGQTEREGRPSGRDAPGHRYEFRTYRNRIAPEGNLAAFSVCVRETDLFLRADRDLSHETLETVHACRAQIETYILHHPEFLHARTPLPEDPLAPDIVRRMLLAARRAEVGPMAAVAGAIAESVGRSLRTLPGISNVMVENGGDIYLDCKRDLRVEVHAGQSSLSGKIILMIRSDRMPLGVCTSSGTVGHSFSYGRADAVCVLSVSAALADAAATRIGNLVKSAKDIERGLKTAEEILPGIRGVVIICGSHMGLAGDVELAG
ncbi:MAG: UPF0280 family protein [Syntrophales bacterium]|nr:UPF0280 family protein [Syntrophales bacterium]HPB70041.1 UPF0280 family protein [Syntrophales bacterium]HQN25289.1 UPF0280 family protein [Syntrophales bacterium]HQP27757.1 UPF0280 family protein [Syntrophales bacterium]